MSDDEHKHATVEATHDLHNFYSEHSVKYVTVGGAHQQYVVDQNGLVFGRSLHGNWGQIHGSLSMISVGGPYSSVVVGCNSHGAIFRLKKASGDNPLGEPGANPWMAVNGQVIWLSVTPTGGLWGVVDHGDDVGNVYFTPNTQTDWTKKPVGDVALTQVSVDPLTNQVVGVTPHDELRLRSGVSLANPMGNRWMRLNGPDGGLKHVSTWGNTLIGSNSQSEVFVQAAGSTKWVHVEGFNVRQVSMGPNGTAVGVNEDGVVCQLKLDLP